MTSNSLFRDHGAMMQFLVYTPVWREDLGQKLGGPEYSYCFVLERFLPVLQRLGEVTAVRDPAREADSLYDECRARGEDCRLLCFCPPHRGPVGLRCPTTLIVAWEFDAIPDEDFGGDPRNDWRVALEDHGQVIMLSNESREAVLRAMGRDFRATAMPAPIYDPIALQSTRGARSPNCGATIRPSGLVIDSRNLRMTTHHLIFEESVALDLASEPWDGSRTTLAFASGANGPDYVGLGGFYDREYWGCWSETSDPWIILPFMLQGTVELEFFAQAFQDNIGRALSFSIGDAKRAITLQKEPEAHAVVVDLEFPTNLIKFEGLIAVSHPEVGDARTMGLGLRSLTVEEKKAPKTRWKPETRTIMLHGVIYTSVLNPSDGRKNWEDIVKAFCFALKDKADATLVLKMTHHRADSFVEKLLRCLRRIGPTACRVVAINAFLDETAYSALRDASAYYVNASRCEGLCIPLMEFMSAGAPAIAPRHTAMRDYVDADSTFIVESSLEPAAWPQDPRRRFRTFWHRIDWASLVRQFQESYRIAACDPECYRRMSVAATKSQASYSSLANVERLLRAHLSN
jgi:glycosyltransferase involved in cell wall biosynthesis